MPTSAPLLPTPSRPFQASPMPLDEAEVAIEAAIIAGALGDHARSKGVETFLAMSAGVLAQRLQAAGLGIVRTAGVKSD